MSDPRLSDLLQAVPALRLKTDAADLEHYGRDWTRRWTPAPLAIALPGSVEEVQAVVRWAYEHGVAVVPSGGRTGLSGGAVAANGELVLSLERMNRVLDFNAVDRTLTVQPGIALEAVHNAAREHGLEYPVDFAARGSCSIGGNIATNAGGIRVIRYGNTREWIAGMKVVTGTGELLDLNRGLIKNSSGYDLRHLMIASEGTLGIVVEATLRLTDPPPPSNVMLLALPSFEVLMRVFAAFRERLQLEAFEFFTDRALHHVLAHGAQKPFEEVHIVLEDRVARHLRDQLCGQSFEIRLEAALLDLRAQRLDFRLAGFRRLFDRFHRQPDVRGFRGDRNGVVGKRTGAFQRADRRPLNAADRLCGSITVDSHLTLQSSSGLSDLSPSYRS